MTYRNNFFYYLMMPGLWIAGALTYLGFGPVYAAYGVVKLMVIMGAHSAWRWDEPLYRIRALRPLMWLVERTISTPATHWAHHALTNADGIGHYKGNFGHGHQRSDPRKTRRGRVVARHLRLASAALGCLLHTILAQRAQI